MGDKMNNAARLENWSLHFKGGDYDPPESWTQHLVGTVYNYKDPARHPDGKRIVTSTIAGIEDGLVITAHGSRYQLGEVDPDYEKEFPNAKERILNIKKS